MNQILEVTGLTRNKPRGEVFVVLAADGAAHAQINVPLANGEKLRIGQRFRLMEIKDDQTT